MHRYIAATHRAPDTQGADNQSAPQFKTFTIHKSEATSRVGITLEDSDIVRGTVVKKRTPGGLAEASGIPIGAKVLLINGSAVTSMEQGANLIKAAAVATTAVSTARIMYGL